MLRCSGGKLELLVKVQPDGRCTQALARLLLGQHVLVRGPIATDEALHRLLSPPRLPAALHCVSGGSGISPMYQLVDGLIRRLEGDADWSDSSLDAAARHESGGRRDRGLPRGARLTARFWSVHRTREDVALPADLADLQQRGSAVGVTIHCTYVFSREQVSRDSGRQQRGEPPSPNHAS